MSEFEVFVDPDKKAKLISQLTDPSSGILTWSYPQYKAAWYDSNVDKIKKKVLDAAARYILELQRHKGFKLESVVIE